MAFKLYPLTGWLQACGAAPAATPAIDISNLPAGMGGEPAYVAAFKLQLTIAHTAGGGSAAVSMQNWAQVLAGIGLQSQVLGDCFGGGGGQLSGTDVFNAIQPYSGWGPLANDCAWPYPNGVGAAAGAVVRVIDLYLPFYNYRLADPTDACPPTIAFRGDQILCTLAATGVLGANHATGNVTCAPFAVLTTKAERRAPTVRHWGVATSANADIQLPGRAYGTVMLCSNLLGLGGPGALSAYTGMQVARNDQYVGLAMTPEAIADNFFSRGCGWVAQGARDAQGAAGSLAWPFDAAAAVAVTGVTLDPQLAVLPVLWEHFGHKLSQISLNSEKLAITTAGVAGTHRVIYSAYAPQSEAFVGRMAGLYGMANPVTRPKLLKPPRDAATGVKRRKTALLPFSLYDQNGR